MEVLIAPLLELIVNCFVLLLPIIIEVWLLALQLVFEVVFFVVEFAIEGSFAAALAARRARRRRRQAEGTKPDQTQPPTKVPTATTAAAETATTPQPTDESPAKPALAAATSVRPATRPINIWHTLHSWSRKAMWVTGILAALTVTGLLLIQLFAFTPATRWLLRQAQTKSGIEVTFDSARGNLFSGKFELEGVRFRRDGNDNSNFDIQIESLETNIDVLALVRRRLRFESVAVRGVSGDYARKTDQEDKPRKDYLVEELVVERAELAMRWKAIEIPLTVDSLHTEKMRSDWAAFDVLFRSEGGGTVFGQALQLGYDVSNDDRTSRLLIAELPAAAAAQHLGGPLKWLTEGRVDVTVNSKWRDLPRATTLTSEWQLVLHDFQAAVPRSTPATTRLIAAPLVAFLNKQATKADQGYEFKFDVELERSIFQGKLWPLSQDLFKIMRRSATVAFTKLAAAGKVIPQAVKDTIKDKAKKGLMKGLKNLIKKK